MTDPVTDFARLRDALRSLPRGDLLIIAERAVELVTQEKRGALLGDYVALIVPGEAPSKDPTLLEAVSAFHHEALRGKYYEATAINARRNNVRSRGTDTFIAEFHRLMRQCVHTGLSDAPDQGLREAFERLFDLLRKIDDGSDQVVHFCDEGGSWQLGMDWPSVMRAYFRVLVACMSPGAYVDAVGRLIDEFARHDRPKLLAMADQIANGAGR